MTSTGRISEAAIDRTIAALAVCSDKLRHRRVTLARSVATEACRRAANGAEFIARVAAETGSMLDVISPEAEARLADRTSGGSGTGVHRRVDTGGRRV